MQTFAEKNWGNCDRAVAYSLNFVQMCYGYDSVFWGDYYASVCNHCNDLSLQIKDYECPKSGFSKKDYYFLDICEYGVSSKLKSDLMHYGVNEDDFRPIYTRNHNRILGWQVAPRNVIYGLGEINGFHKTLKCKDCNYFSYEVNDDVDNCDAYNGLGYPEYIDRESLKSIRSIARVAETGSILIPVQTYEELLKTYPRIECRPVFLGNVYEDEEYLKNHQGDNSMCSNHHDD